MTNFTYLTLNAFSIDAFKESQVLCTYLTRIELKIQIYVLKLTQIRYR